MDGGCCVWKKRNNLKKSIKVYILIEILLWDVLKSEGVKQEEINSYTKINK